MDYKLYTDNQLLLQLQRGDVNAYIALYDRYHHGLHAWVLSFVKIPGLAQDIIQETFLKIWEIKERLNPDQSFPAFLYRISRNRALKLLKKITADDKLRVQVMQRLQTTAETPEHKLQWQQYQQLLGQAISQLPRQRQRIFKLCRQEGKSYEEAAQELGISRNTVKEHMVMAMKDIKEYFYRHGDLSLSLLMIISITSHR